MTAVPLSPRPTGPLSCALPPLASTILLTLSLIVPGDAAAQGHGSLRIQGPPGVNVEWEGIALGTIGTSGELLIEEIPPGGYTVTAHRSDHESRTYRVRVDGDDQTLRIRALEPVEEFAPASPPSPDSEELPSEPVAEPPSPLGAVHPNLEVGLETRPRAAEHSEDPSEPSEQDATPEFSTAAATDPAPAPAEDPLPTPSPEIDEESESSLLLFVGLPLLGIIGIVLWSVSVFLRKHEDSHGDEPPRVERSFPAVGKRARPDPETSRLREELERRERELEWRSFELRERGRDPEVIDLQDFNAGESREQEGES